MEPGGAERVGLNLANWFAEKGFRSDLVLVQRRGSLIGQITSGVRVIDLAQTRAARAILPFRRYVLNERPNAVLAINFEVNVAAGLALIGVKPKPTLIMSVHCPPSFYFRLASWPWVKAMMIASKFACRYSDYLVAVSGGVALEVRSLGWLPSERIILIPNPVLDGRLAVSAKSKSEHPWLGSHEIPVVISAGRLTPEKNFGLLIEAFQRVLADRAARLLILGEGACRTELEGKIAQAGLADAVELFGYASNPYPYIREADVFALSSDYEGFGNVLVEAMAVGTPIVSTDAPHGPREILENGKWGRLVSTGNADALAAAILESLDAPRGSAQARVREFTVEASGGRYLELMTGRPVRLT